MTRPSVLLLRTAAAVVAVVAITSTVWGNPFESTAPAAPVPQSDVCGDEVRPTMQEGGHLIGDTEPPVPFSSSPPTSGWHKSGAPRLGVIAADDPLSDPEVVSALEAGDVVVAYDPDRVAGPTVARLTELAQSTFDGQVTLTAYVGADAPLTLTGWGVLRGCTDLDETALEAFVSAHHTPEQGH